VGLTDLLLGILERVVANQACNELKAWTPWTVDWLIRRAVRRLPDDQRARLDEEWRSHVSEVPGELGKLVTAIGFLRASSRLLDAPPIWERLLAFMVFLLLAPAVVLLMALLKISSPKRSVFERRDILLPDGSTFRGLALRSDSALGARIKQVRLDDILMFYHMLRGRVRFPWREALSETIHLIFGTPGSGTKG
jgi:hypothetical protein